MVAWWPLPCDIIVADRGQHKVEVVAKKKKIGNNQLEVWQHEWWHGSNCHVISSWQAVGSTKWKWQQKKKKGNNQLEVQQHEWWCGGKTLLWQAGGIAKWKWWQ